MRVVVASFVLVLALAASGLDIPFPDNVHVFDYHRKFGIEKASRIKKLEEQAIFQDGNGQRIVGGSLVDISQVPYQVGLVMRFLYIYQSICGGSLISSTRIVTAAHCKWDGVLTAQSFTCALGSNTIFFGGTRITTTDVTMHPQWNPNTLANDIAVIRIPPVAFSNVIQTIALPSGNLLNNNFAGWTALASGYGRTVNGGDIPATQRVSWVTVPVITNVACARVFGPFARSTNICTSGEGGRGTCQGDSGGPLSVSSGGRRVLIGVASFGAEAGCSASLPSAFARVTSFTSWILTI